MSAGSLQDLVVNTGSALPSSGSAGFLASPTSSDPVVTHLHRSSTALFSVSATQRSSIVSAYPLPSLDPVSFTLPPLAVTCLSDFRGTHVVLGDKSGRVSLLSLTPSLDAAKADGAKASARHFTSQFTPKHPRPSTCLSTTDRHIAVGLQSYRRDFCVYVYTADTGGSVIKYANAEPTSSVLFTGERTLLTGHEGIVRLYDTRSQNQPISVPCHSGTDVKKMEMQSEGGNVLLTVGIDSSSNGVGVEQVCLWDIRKFTSPITALKPSRSERLVTAFFNNDLTIVTVDDSSADGERESRGVVREYAATSNGTVAVRPNLRSSKYLNTSVTQAVPLTQDHAMVLTHKGGTQVVNSSQRRSLGMARDGTVAVDCVDNVRLVSNTAKYDAAGNNSSVNIEDIMKGRAELGYGLLSRPTGLGAGVDEAWRFVERGQWGSDFVEGNFTDGRGSGKTDDSTAVFDDENRTRICIASGWIGNESGDSNSAAEVLGSGVVAAVCAVFVTLDFEAVVPWLSNDVSCETECALVKMCVCGYKPSSPGWIKACTDLIVTLQSRPGRDMKYLAMLCIFMLNKDKDDLPWQQRFPFLRDTGVAICDRLAFASKFLRAASLKEYVQGTYEACLATGDISGLILTGLGSTRGIALLQRYVDITGDVQTAALLTSRLLAPNIVHEWLETYRDLLNGWSMWTTRAKLDIQRGELLRKNGVAALVGGAGMVEGKSAKASKVPKTLAEDLVKVPKQLFTRCNYCNLSLPLNVLRRQEGTSDSWLMRQKPVLAACPGCTKPLPKCYVCLLNLGCLNPYLEKKRMREVAVGQKKGGGESGLEDLANLPFLEWWSWCNQCHHGGHAQHLMSWFEKHDRCGVSECNCRCKPSFN
jgi:hypothetical protein